MTKTEERRKVKLERRAESRRRANLRDMRRDERDQKLKIAADGYLAITKRIWRDWRDSK